MQNAIILLAILNVMAILIPTYFFIIYIRAVNKLISMEKVTVASKEQTTELDDTLGLVKVSTYLEEDTYNKTIDQICTDQGIIPAAALRCLIDNYQLQQWICVADQDNYEHLLMDELVLIKDDNQIAYLFGNYNPNKKEWLHVDDKNNYLPLPEDFNITHWKFLD